MSLCPLSTFPASLLSVLMTKCYLSFLHPRLGPLLAFISKDSSICHAFAILPLRGPVFAAAPLTSKTGSAHFSEYAPSRSKLYGID